MQRPTVQSCWCHWSQRRSGNCSRSSHWTQQLDLGPSPTYTALLTYQSTATHCYTMHTHLWCTTQLTNVLCLNFELVSGLCRIVFYFGVVRFLKKAQIRFGTSLVRFGLKKSGRFGYCNYFTTYAALEQLIYSKYYWVTTTLIHCSSEEQQWSLLNRFCTEQWHCGACRRKWRLTDTDLCPCGKTQMMSHMSNPVPWQNWMAAYLGYTLWMKTLFCGWPVMVHDTHKRRSEGQDLFSSIRHNDK